MPDRTEATGKLLSVDMAAKRADVHRVTILRLIRSGDLAAVRLGKRLLRIPEEDFARFLSRHRLPRHRGDAA